MKLLNTMLALIVVLSASSGVASAQSSCARNKVVDKNADTNPPSAQVGNLQKAHARK